MMGMLKWTMSDQKNVKPPIRTFASFEEENRAESLRRSKQTSTERWVEFNLLQDRLLGEGWRERPIVKVASWEIVAWFNGPE